MTAIHSMSGKQVAELSEALLAAVAEELEDLQYDRIQDCRFDAADIRNALAAALAAQFADAAGGVLIVWWDKENGLRMNPAAVPGVED